MNKEIGTSVARNTTVMMGAQVITWISSFVLLMFLPRYLGSVDYGRLYLAISITMILGIIIDFGGNYLIPKEVSRSKDDTPQILISFIGVRSILWLVCICLLLLFSYQVNYPPVVIYLILILGVSKLAEGVMTAIKGCFQGYEIMEYPSFGMIVQQVFVSVVAVGALFMGAGPVIVAVIMAIGVILNLITCYRFLPKIVEKLPGLRFDVPFSLIKKSIPYFLWSIFAVIYYRIDAVMLSMFSTDQVVGWYGGAYRFFDIVMFLPSILTTVLFPILSKLTEGEDHTLARTFQQSLKYIVIAGIPMCILFYAFAGNIIDLFYGTEEYGPSVLILKIFSAGILLVYIDFILGSTILATDKQKKLAIVGFAAILLNIGLNYFLIPFSQLFWSNGGIGAALSTLVTEAFILVSALLMLPKIYFRNYNMLTIAWMMLSGLTMGSVLWVMQGSGIHWIGQAVVSLLVYLTVLLVLNVITRREVYFLKEFFEERSFLSFLTTKREHL